MKNETVEELRREEALIKAWIRDITAPKMGRLKGIRLKLKGLLSENGPKPEKTSLR